MSLNIKNPEPHKLAQEIASLTGESLSSAVTEALQERLARLDGARKQRLARLAEIAAICTARLNGPGGMMEINDLHDQSGLPKRSSIRRPPSRSCDRKRDGSTFSTSSTRQTAVG